MYYLLLMFAKDVMFSWSMTLFDFGMGFILFILITFCSLSSLYFQTVVITKKKLFLHVLQGAKVMTSSFWAYEMAELCTDSTSDQA